MQGIMGEYWWVAVLVVYLIESAKQLMLMRYQNQARQDAHSASLPSPLPAAPPVLIPPPPVVLPPPAVPAAPVAPVAPVVVSPAAPVIKDDYPAWFRRAQQELGFHETGDNQGIQKYIDLAHTGAEGEPWCAIFANAMLEAVGIRGSRSPSSQSFRTDPNFVQLPGPAKGAIVVFWRISKSSGQGHVGFYDSETATQVRTLGGNEDNAVMDELLPKDSATFGLVGYYWPKSVALPAIGAVSAPAKAAPAAATPTTVNPAAVQTNITATVFGSAENDNHSTAYGKPLDDNTPGVALPFHFPAPLPRVRLTNTATGKTVDADVVDVGPWNTNNPYWKLGQRPESETSFNNKTPLPGPPNAGRVAKNPAGIDLTIAAANAIGVDGKGIVSWSFIDPSTPSVT